MADDPKLYRKKRGGREYGSFYTTVAGFPVNLGTSDPLEAARAAARRKLEGLAPRAAAGGEPAAAPPVQAPRAPAAAPRPSPLAAWAGGAAPAAAPATPAAPEPAALSPSMVALADGMAGALAKFNAAAVAMGVKYFAAVQPPKIDPDELEALEKAWSTGVQELMSIHGIRWWHIVIAQSAALGANLYQSGTPIQTTPGAPTPSTSGGP